MTQGQVDGAHVLGEAADGDAVDAGFGDGADALQVDAAGGFQFGAAFVEAHGFAHLVQVHVVQQDHAGAGGEGFAHLLDRIGAVTVRPPVDPALPPMIADLVTNPVPDVLATAYAPPPPDYASVSPFDSILTEKQEDQGRFIPDIGPQDHAWAATPLPASVFSNKEQKCLAEGIYFEARGEAVKGQAAVAQVILNRVRNPHYPDTICGVVYQNEDWRNRCQFSFACDHIPDIVTSPRHWKIAKEIAMAVTAGKIWFKDVGSATHYHATYVSPAWGPTMKRVEKIGKHIFYRTYGGGWS